VKDYAADIFIICAVSGGRRRVGSTAALTYDPMVITARVLAPAVAMATPAAGGSDTEVSLRTGRCSTFRWDAGVASQNVDDERPRAARHDDPNRNEPT